MIAIEHSAMAAGYARDGYLLLRSAVPEAMLAGLQAVIERHVHRYAEELVAAGKAAELHAEAPFDRRLAAICEGSGVSIRKWHAFLFCREMHALASTPAIVDALSALLGPEVTFHGDYQLTPKLPGSKPTAFPWHQDTQYYGVPSRHMHVVTAWVPLVDADEENGCLWVMPGSHRWGLLDAVRGADLNFQPRENIERLGQAIPMPMRRGDVLLLGNFTFHASRVNRSRGVRWSVDLGYSATPGSRDLDEDEAASYRYLYGNLPRVGRTQLVVRSIDRSREQTWEDWLEQRTAQLRQFAVPPHSGLRPRARA